jgi:hypothetical protein
MQTEKNNSSPEETPESINQEANTGELKKGAELSESITELPVYKLHASFEGIFFIKAATPQEAKAKLLQLKLEGNIKDDHITWLETIPFEQYKDFKVEIID